MATAIIPKSEFRKNFNLQQGYGEIPGFMERGTIYYALPDGTRTTDKRKAERMADKLDAMIRRGIQQNPQRKLH